MIQEKTDIDGFIFKIVDNQYIIILKKTNTNLDNPLNLNVERFIYIKDYTFKQVHKRLQNLNLKIS